MRLFILLTVLAVLVSACGDSADGPSASFDASGTYSDVSITNAASVFISGCTGDLTTLNGHWADEALAVCTYSPLTIVQIGSQWSIGPAIASCDDGSGPTPTTITGSGTVFAQLQGVMTSDDGSGVLQHFELWGGEPSGGALVVRATDLRVSGAATGKCSFGPSMRIELRQ